MTAQDFSTKLERIADDIGDIKVTAARQEENLKEHMRRTALAEEAIQLARKEAAEKARALEAELQPVKDHVVMVNSVLKFVGGLAVIVGLVAGVIQLFQLLRG